MGGPVVGEGPRRDRDHPLEGPWKKFPCMGTCTIYRQDGCRKNQDQKSRTHPPEALLGEQRRPRVIRVCSCDQPKVGSPALGPPSSTARWCWTLSQSPRPQALSQNFMPPCVPRHAEPVLPSQIKPMPTASLHPAEEDLEPWAPIAQLLGQGLLLPWLGYA